MTKKVTSATQIFGTDDLDLGDVNQDFNISYDYKLKNQIHNISKYELVDLFELDYTIFITQHRLIGAIVENNPTYGYISNIFTTDDDGQDLAYFEITLINLSEIKHIYYNNKEFKDLIYNGTIFSMYDYILSPQELMYIHSNKPDYRDTQLILGDGPKVIFKLSNNLTTDKS